MICSVGQGISWSLGGAWIWIVQFGQTVPPLILALAALYAYVFILRARIAERKLNSLIAKDANASAIKDQKKVVDYLLAFSTLLPIWLLCFIGVAIAWNFIILLRALLKQLCFG